MSVLPMPARYLLQTQLMVTQACTVMQSRQKLLNNNDNLPIEG